MTMTNHPFDTTTESNIKSWLEGDYDQETKDEIQKLITSNPQAAADAFYTHLSFGTGGLRGIMGVGTNRMNGYTVRAATQGLANYIQRECSNEQNLAVCIGYDSRHQSRFFAEESAKVLAANEIKAYLFAELRPTPLISFACREKQCQAAIMITASHNPPEYNGYKVYWKDGGQVVPPHDRGIIDEVTKIKQLAQVKTVDDINHPAIKMMGEEIDTLYLDTIEILQHYPKDNQKNGKDLKIVYTSLHGTGITLAPQALSRWGFTDLTLVDEQVIPDGSFPTVHSPNPEEPIALQMGIDVLEKCQGDLLIANDPDADRVGVVVRHQGKCHLLSGNEVACLCLEHICASGQLPEHAAFIKTIGTSELFQAIANLYHAPCFNVLTGFKYIAEMIHQWELDPKVNHQYVFGGEESYGYLLGTYTRDKDAISSAALICEAALQAKLEGKTLVDKLHKLFAREGVFKEKLRSFTFDPGQLGQEQMAQKMATLRKNPPQMIADIPVVAIEDYQTSTATEIATGHSEPLTLPKSNVLLYWLKDRSKVMVRPSGTEPKVKIYCGVQKGIEKSVEETIMAADAHANKLLDELETIFNL